LKAPVDGASYCMSYFDAFILGVIQGLAEFLPVSSSGHLVLAEELLRVKAPGVTFEVLVHLGTLASVLIYFRKQILTLVQSLFVRKMKRERMMVWYLILGTIPAGLAGVLLKDFFERMFSSPVQTSIDLIVTGFILLSLKFFKQGSKHLGIGSVIAMGIGQAFAILPGISRSGTTIVSGIATGTKPAEAAEFAFLLSIPAIAGAAVIKSRSMAGLESALVGPYLLAAAIAFIFGLVAVYAVLKSIKRGKLHYFGYYCFAAGLLGLYLFR
jgi:undecaprenyl-diphosphatase